MALGAAHRLEQAGGFVAHDGRRGVHQHRVEIALQRDVARHEFADDAKVDRPVDTEDAGAAESLVGELRRRALGVEDDGEILWQCRDDLADPVERGRLVVRTRDDAAPRVEDLDRIGAGADLHLEIRDERDREFFHQRVEERAVAEEQFLNAAEIVGAAALDHVGRESPRRTAETEQRFLALEFRLHERERLAHVVEALRDRVGPQRVELGARVETVFHPDAALLAEFVALAHRLGDDEDVGENNRGVESEAPQRLQRHFGGERGRSHHLEEGALGLEGAVFGKVTAGLAHHPDGRSVELFAGAGGEETLAGVHGLTTDKHR